MQNIINFFTNRKNFKYFLFIALFLLYFWNLGTYGLLNPDEGRYSEIPREMLESGNFFSPHLNYVLYFEKPPLHYWLTALSFVVFGQNEFASRFIPVMMGLLSILMMWYFVRKFYDEDLANLSATILGTSGLFFILSRINITDMTLSFFLTLSLFSFYIFYKENKKFWLYVFYSALALATLAKGLIGVVLPAGIIFWFMVITRKWDIMKRLFFSPAILVFFLICVPPFYIMCKENPKFFYFFFIQEHFLRYATKMHERYAPFYFFIPVIIGGFFPWLMGLFVSTKNYFSKGKEDVLYLSLWVLIITLFFSASSSKLVPYIVPVYPALAIIIAKNILMLKEGHNKTLKAGIWFFTIFTIILCLGAFLVLNGYIPIEKVEDVLLYKKPLVNLCVLCFVFSIIFWCLLKNRKHLLWSYIVFAMLFLAVANPVFIILGGERSTQRVCRKLVPLLNPQDKIIDFDDYEQDLPFYTKRRVAIYNWVGELEFGRDNDANHENWFFPSTRVQDAINIPIEEGQKLYLIVRDEYKQNMPENHTFEFVDKEGVQNIYVRTK